MKKLFSALFLIGLIILTPGCSEDPDPEIRVLNLRENKANVQVKSNTGNTVNINDVVTGQLTIYQGLPPATLTISAVIQNESEKPETSFRADKGSKYTIVIVGGPIASIRIDRE